MLAILACALSLSQNPTPQRYGVTFSIPQNPTEETYLSALRDQIRCGVTGSAITFKWKETELSPGEFADKAVEDMTGITKFLDSDVFILFSTVDTNQKITPSDLASKPFDDPEMLKRFREYLMHFVPKLPKKTTWVSLGNEVNIYFSSHPDEVAAYKKFLAEGRQVVKAIRPDLKVGVTLTYGDSKLNPALSQSLSEGMDVFPITYYPLDAFKVQPVSVVPSDLDAMVKMAGGRPVVLQEMGYPASPICGSSEEKQADFINTIMDELPKRSGIVFASYFMQFDFWPDQVTIFKAYYGIDKPEFGAYLGSLGLKDSTGKPRKAWASFVKKMQLLSPVK